MQKHLAFQEVRYRRWEVPRTDLLFDWDYEEKKREELYGKYPILKENRVILVCTDIPRRWE